MKLLPVILFFLLFAAGTVSAQPDQPVEFAKVFKAPKFFEELLDFSSGKTDLTRLDAFVMVPYSSIQFVKSDKGFTGRYSATISIFDKDKEKLIEEKTWNEKLDVNNFDQTVSKENNSVSLKSFFLQPGKYFIRSSIHNQEANTDYLLEKEYKVRDLSSDFSISDIMILAKRTEENGIKKITPNVTGNVIVQKEGLPLFFEIYSNTRGRLNIDYKITDSKNKKIFEDIMFKDVDSGRTQIFHTIKDSTINLGVYTLEVDLKNSDNKTVASAKKKFISRWMGVPALITDLDKAVDEMIYIASPHDIDTINQAPNKEEKLKRFLAYWKKINPTPESDNNPVFDEYYRRVEYANEHFSDYFQGWRSDRGMVFILLGLPDNVDRHPFEIDTKPYEVWEYYNLNLSLIFVDRTGFGDYRLVTPLTGDLYRFRM
jgi:GWxTD domain-containing protein